MKKTFHKIAHWLGWNYGKVVSFECEGCCYIGFMCYECRDITGAHETHF